MTGPEHYEASERLLTEAEVIAQQGGDMGEMLAAAQVHATLALAAAAAQGPVQLSYGALSGPRLTWSKVLRPTQLAGGDDHA